MLTCLFIESANASVSLALSITSFAISLVAICVTLWDASYRLNRTLHIESTFIDIPQEALVISIASEGAREILLKEVSVIHNYEPKGTPLWKSEREETIKENGVARNVITRDELRKNATRTGDPSEYNRRLWVVVRHSARRKIVVHLVNVPVQFFTLDQPFSFQNGPATDEYLGLQPLPVRYAKLFPSP